jgi:hypothetical protein
MGLFNSAVLDWAIGIIFVYLLLAIICTSINEWISGLTSARAGNLSKAIRQLLDNQKGSNPTLSFLQEFYAHPLISGMMTPGKQASAAHPSYLPSRTFATAIMDLATKAKPGSITFQDLENGVKNLPEGDVRTAVLALLQNADGDLDRAQKSIEQWFDDSMERASGWFKRRTQWVTIALAALLTIGTNADTVRIGQMLWKNPTLRASLVEKAKSRSETGKESDARGVAAEYPDKNNPLKPVFKPTKDELDALKPLLGWADQDVRDLGAWPSRLLGWSLSIAAISLGAPFWFDTLSKLMSVRNVGKRPEKSDDRDNAAKKSGAAQQAPAAGGN